MKIAAKPFYGWWVLLSASTVLMTAFSMSAYALPVFYPELVQAFHWPRVSVALGGSFKTFLVGLAAPLNGWIIDRRGVKPILIAGVLTLGVSYALLSGIDSLWQYFLLCFFLGLGGSWTHHLPNQLLVANWFARRRGMAIGILTTFSGFGDALIPILSATLIQSAGWRGALLILPLLLIVPFLAVTFLVRDRPQDIGLLADGALEPATEPWTHATKTRAPGDPSPDLAIFKTTTFWMIAGLFAFTAWSTFSVWQHFVLFLRDEGFSPTVAASLFGLFLASSTVSRFVSGPLSDKISADSTMLLNLVLIALALSALISSRSPGVIYFSMIVFGIGYGGSITCRPLVIFEHFGAAGVGRLYGVATALFTSGAFVGPGLSGYIFDRTGSYHLAFLLALILISISIALVILLRRSVTKGARNTKPTHDPVVSS